MAEVKSRNGDGKKASNTSSNSKVRSGTTESPPAPKFTGSAATVELQPPASPSAARFYVTSIEPAKTTRRAIDFGGGSRRAEAEAAGGRQGRGDGGDIA